MEIEQRFLEMVTPYAVGKEIRLGRVHDGGYVVPEMAMEQSNKLVSLGIRDDPSFDVDAMKIFPNLEHDYMFDCNNSTIPQGDKFIFTKVLVNTENCLSNLVDLSGSFVKMDVEGSEFEIIDSIEEQLPEINGMVMEVHWLYKTTNFIRAFRMLEKIDKYFLCTHLHGNNHDLHRAECWWTCGSAKLTTTLEISWINKRLVSAECPISNVGCPVPGLDMPCQRGTQEAVMDFWLKNK